MSAEKFEEAFAKIYQFSQGVNYIIKITEAPHYRRFCFEQKAIHGEPQSPHRHPGHLPDDLMQGRDLRESIGRAPSGVNSGKGFTFISYRGDIMPSGFLPIAAGNIRTDSLTDVYRNSPLFRQLRDTTLLKGRCGICAYKDMCGGSRARAYALTGDYLAEDPCCSYQPETDSLQKEGA